MKQKILKLVDKEKEKTLEEIAATLVEHVREGRIKQLAIFWEGLDGYAYSSHYSKSKWELIGMIHQQIIFWTAKQIIGEDE